ncbi:unnamed protein product [Symbiodinium sp. CCMP2592]|nr:unnamed protein product [Symbiodinium sp. CCMP2592]
MGKAGVVLIPEGMLDCFAATREDTTLHTSRTMQVHNEEVIDLLAPLPPLQSKALLHVPSASVQIEFSLSGGEPRGTDFAGVVELPGASAHVLGLTQCFVESVGEAQHERRRTRARIGWTMA